uniref:peptidyl-tRNA hydrolase n=1 Tax=Picocystis salinarum TaxID=88271 RepID=A0A7S3UF50_9CHLO
MGSRVARGRDVVGGRKRRTRMDWRMASGAKEAASNLVQYVVMRKDLSKELGWPMGSLVAQACHATVAATWLHREDEHTKQYCAEGNLAHMHKVVLEVKGQTQLVNLSKKLEDAGIRHKLWVEQPENFPTCLATKPYPKEDIQAHFRKLNLCK